MNNYKIIIEEFQNQNEANKGVNEFIQECTEGQSEILDIASHITADPDGNNTYVFIYKVSTHCEDY